MSLNKPVIHRMLKITLVVVVCFVLLSLLAPVSFAQDSHAVSVKVTIAPAIHVSPDGTIRSNVSTLAFEGSALLTVIAR